MIETNLIIAIFIISETDLMSIDKLLMKNAQVIYLNFVGWEEDAMIWMKLRFVFRWRL